MDNFFRLMRLLLWLAAGLYLGGYAVLVSAEVTQYPSVKKWYTESADSASNYSDAVAACTALAGLVGEVYYGTTGYVAGNPPLYLDSYHYCSWRRFSTPVCPVGQYCGQSSGIKSKPRMTCPYDGTLSVDQASCTNLPACPSGQTRASNGQCSEDCSLRKGQSVSSGWYDIGISPTALPPWLPISCNGGCQVQFSGTVPAGQDSQNPRHYYARGSFEYDGWTCSAGGAGTPAPGGEPPSSQCPTGQCPGTVNGQPVCVPCGSQGTTQTTTTTTSTTSSGGAPGTTTTTTSTDGTSVTTTTSSTSGTPGQGTTAPAPTTQSEKQDKEGFCVENPESPICKISSFGGSCGAFSCDGDAVQCAMAKEQHKRNCTMFDTDTAESTLGKLAAAGNDPQAPNYPTAPGKVENVNLSTALDTTNPFAAGCVQDKTFQIMTTTLVIPFSNICQYLEIMGTIVLVFSMLGAVRIMLGGI